MYKQLNDLYLQNRQNMTIDCVSISFEQEKQLISDVIEYNQRLQNPFITGVLEYYQEQTALSDSQWFHLIKFWLRNNIPSQSETTTASDKIKTMLGALKS